MCKNQLSSSKDVNHNSEDVARKYRATGREGGVMTTETDTTAAAASSAAALPAADAALFALRDTTVSGNPHDALRRGQAALGLVNFDA